MMKTTTTHDRNLPCLALLVCILLLSACGGRTAPVTSQTVREPVVGLPCEGCDAVFEGMPETLGWQTRIAAAGEGEAMRIEGVVRDGAGSVVPGVIVYAYHTDANGLYPRDEGARGTSAYRHGRLRGWAQTGPQGEYRFDTIRPGGYPGTEEPEHVHLHVIEPGRCTYYIDDVLFEDDPRLTEGKRAQLVRGRGGNGVTSPVRDREGTWIVARDILLGEKIPGYPPR